MNNWVWLKLKGIFVFLVLKFLGTSPEIWKKGRSYKLKLEERNLTKKGSIKNATKKLMAVEYYDGSINIADIAFFKDAQHKEISSRIISDCLDRSVECSNWEKSYLAGFL